jgi:hypothetical protein
VKLALEKEEYPAIRKITKAGGYGSLRSQGRPVGVRRLNYTDAVVTPPSTTMVWPVMKVEASEPR